MVTTCLRDMQLPAATVMAVSGHKSEIQMRQDYGAPASATHGGRANPRGVYRRAYVPHQSWADFDPSTRSRASLSMWRYVSGELPRLPDNAVEAYSRMVNQSAFLCGTNSKNNTALPLRETTDQDLHGILH